MASCLALGGAVASAAPKPASCGVRGRLRGALQAAPPLLPAPARRARLARSVPATAASDGPPVHERRSREARVLDLPVSSIRRPLAKTRANDPAKVQWLMESISEIGLQEPIDVLEVDGAYFGFSGCHRFGESALDACSHAASSRVACHLRHPLLPRHLSPLR
jgi:uncharacterized ParB-like nuclease family protein